MVGFRVYRCWGLVFRAWGLGFLRLYQHLLKDLQPLPRSLDKQANQSLPEFALEPSPKLIAGDDKATTKIQTKMTCFQDTFVTCFRMHF